MFTLRCSAQWSLRLRGRCIRYIYVVNIDSFAYIAHIKVLELTLQCLYYTQNNTLTASNQPRFKKITDDLFSFWCRIILLIFRGKPRQTFLRRYSLVIFPGKFIFWSHLLRFMKFSFSMISFRFKLSQIIRSKVVIRFLITEFVSSTPK